MGKQVELKFLRAGMAPHIINSQHVPRIGEFIKYGGLPSFWEVVSITWDDWMTQATIHTKETS